jgi:hypothetical protein
VALIFEIPDILRTGAYTAIFAHPLLFLASGTLGILVNFSAFWVIQVSTDAARTYPRHIVNAYNIVPYMRIRNKTDEITEA